MTLSISRTWMPWNICAHILTTVVAIRLNWDASSSKILSVSAKLVSLTIPVIIPSSFLSAFRSHSVPPDLIAIDIISSQSLSSKPHSRLHRECSMVQMAVWLAAIKVTPSLTVTLRACAAWRTALSTCGDLFELVFLPSRHCRLPESPWCGPSSELKRM